ncbi:MAG: DUF4388 domain-containing protein [Verrucomicrobiota bacterium]
MASTSKARDLIYTTNFVESSMSVGDVQSWFQSQLSAVSIGVVGGGRYGLITRRHLNQTIVSAANTKDILKKSITEIMVAEPLVVDAEDELDAVVSRLCREKQEDEEFFNDIVVLESGTFMGLISVREVLTNHIENISHMLTATQAQKQALSNKNKQLFDNNFKSGFMGSQYRMLFEEAYIPMIFFDEQGKLSAFNRRFMELVGIPRHQLESETLFGHIFDATFKKVVSLAQSQKEAGEAMTGVMREVTIKLSGGSTATVTVYFEMSPDNKRLIANILSATDPEEPAVSDVQNIYDDPVAGGTPGKITQAINTKLVNEQAMGLARSVATNLIDREQSVDRLMKKLEQIIGVAEQIESQGQSPGASRDLVGNLADFSMIDLCQIISQGGKTGCLVVENPDTGHVGKIYFIDGQIIHAFTNEGHHAIDALPVLLSLRDGHFAFHLGEQPEEATISGDTMGLLMEACQNIDENH